MNVPEEVESRCSLCTVQYCGKTRIPNTWTQMKAGETVSSREMLPPISDSSKSRGTEKNGAAEFQVQLLLHNRNNPSRLREFHVSR